MHGIVDFTPLNASFNICGFNKAKRQALTSQLALTVQLVLLDQYNGGRHCLIVYMKNKRTAG